jgi:hypothetical protein
MVVAVLGAFPDVTPESIGRTSTSVYYVKEIQIVLCRRRLEKFQRPQTAHQVETSPI